MARQDFPSLRNAALAGVAGTATVFASCSGAAHRDPPQPGSVETPPMTRILDDPRKEWPFRFEHHNFGAYCYDAIGCRIRYGGDFPHGAGSDDERSGPMPELREAQRAWHGSRLALQAFTTPVTARWRSLDGERHSVEIDLDEVFPDRLIPHKVAFDELSERGAAGRPDIVVVVNDRTISVWVAMMIPLNKPDNPANPHSNVRYDWIEAWSRTL